MYCSDVRFTVDEILVCKVPYMDNVETDRDNFNQKIEVWLWDDMYANDKKSYVNLHLRLLLKT